MARKWAEAPYNNNNNNKEKEEVQQQQQQHGNRLFSVLFVFLAWRSPHLFFGRPVYLLSVGIYSQTNFGMRLFFILDKFWPLMSMIHNNIGTLLNGIIFY